MRDIGSRIGRRAAVCLPLLVVLAGQPLAVSANADAAYTLTVAKAGLGSGTVTSSQQPGIDCGATCSAVFAAGTSIDLTAVASAGSVFVAWGNACSGSTSCQVTMDAAKTVAATFQLSYRPDAWVKLCGAGDNCDNAPPHPYRGEDVFNNTGAHQTVTAGVEEGNDIRFWITLENDGTQTDSFVLQGCKGNPGFVIRVVNVGALRHAQAAPVITTQFKSGTARFDFAGSSTSQDVVITVDIWAKTPVFNATYACPITITSTTQPTRVDRVIAKMHTV